MEPEEEFFWAAVDVAVDRGERFVVLCAAIATGR